MHFSTMAMTAMRFVEMREDADTIGKFHLLEGSFKLSFLT